MSKRPSFLLCVTENSSPLPAANADWLHLARPALAAKTVHHTVFLYAATLSGLSPIDQIKNRETQMSISIFGALEGTRTPDLLIRSQALYPAELLALMH